MSASEWYGASRSRRRSLCGEALSGMYPAKHVVGGKPIYDLEYAADTPLVAVSLPKLQSFLQAVQVAASRSSLELNADKTELFVTPGSSQTISFVYGDPVPTTESATT